MHKHGHGESIIYSYNYGNVVSALFIFLQSIIRPIQYYTNLSKNDISNLIKKIQRNCEWWLRL